MAQEDEVTKYLKGEMSRAKAEVKAILDTAESEGRPIDPDDQAKIDRHMETISAAKARIEQKETNARVLQVLEDVVDGPPPSQGAPIAKSLGDAFLDSEAWRALKDSGRHRGEKWDTGDIFFDTKLTDGGSPALTVEATSIAGGTLPLNPQVLPTLAPGDEAPLVVADLFGQGQATTNTLVYLEETTTNAGALDSDYSSDSLPPISENVTTEGAAKPAASIDFTKRTITLFKMAAVMPISDEMLEDEPQLSSYINNRLGIFVRQGEEAHLINTLLTGIQQTNPGGVGGTNGFDSLAAGHYLVQQNGGLNPDAILINPVDFWRLAVTKSTASGDYFSGGPYAGPARNPWGTRTVITPAIQSGRPIVGAFREGATLWRRGGISIAASNGYNDYFRKDLTLLRAVTRVGLAIYRPKAFAQCLLP